MSSTMDSILGILTAIIILGVPIILFVGGLIMFCIALLKILKKENFKNKEIC